MKGIRRNKPLSIATAAVVGAIALTVFNGATRFEWAVVGKDDRAASIADCRLAEMRSADICTDVRLPATTTEAYEVMPGLSIIEQVEGRG